MGCSPEWGEDPLHSGVSTSKWLDGTVDVFGVVPDGYEHVSVNFKNGESKKVPVYDNVFAVNLPDYPQTVTLAASASSDKTTLLVSSPEN